MKKTTHKFLLLLILIVGMVFAVTSFNQVDAEETDTSFTVTFVDKEGDVLKTIECDEAPCEIIPPLDLDDIGNREFLRWSVFESEFSSINEDTVIKPIYSLDNIIFSVNVFGWTTLTVQAYAFFIVSGIIVAVLLALKECPRVGLEQDDFLDGFLWITPLAIIGARLWYVIYEPSSFIGGSLGDSLLRIIGFTEVNGSWEFVGLAGLAIHGAFITAVILAYFYTRRKKIDVLKLLDIVAVGFIIAQAFGRWGNFFNQEAHGGLVGGYTGSVTSAVANISVQEQYEYLRNTLHIPEFIVNNMYIERATNALAQEPLTGFYHPTFFYELTLNLIGFSIMLILRRIKKIHIGEIFAFYLIWYGGVRIFIETMRTDPLLFDFLGMTFKTAIVTSAVMILIGISVSVFVRLKRKDQTYASSLHTFNF
jgi:phosphatidylglycerol:prolipoprotein diacylglycerol transferase